MDQEDHPVHGLPEGVPRHLQLDLYLSCFPTVHILLLVTAFVSCLESVQLILHLLVTLWHFHVVDMEGLGRRPSSLDEIILINGLSDVLLRVDDHSLVPLQSILHLQTTFSLTLYDVEHALKFLGEDVVPVYLFDHQLVFILDELVASSNHKLLIATQHANGRLQRLNTIVLVLVPTLLVTCECVTLLALDDRFTHRKFMGWQQNPRHNTPTVIA